MFQEINTIMTRKNEPKAIGIHYRRIEVRPISLPRNKEEYNSDGLFTDCDMPCKIVICFVKTASKVGDYSTNPFEFARKWEIPTTLQKNFEQSDREKRLELRIKEIEEKFQKFQAAFDGKEKGKGKGRGKKNSTETEEEIASEIGKEAQRRLRSFLEAEEASTSTASCYRPSAPHYEPSEQSQDSTVCASNKNVFIRKIEILLNGSPIDQVEDKQNEDECIQAYWRMFTFNGQMNSLFTNGIRQWIN